MKLHPWGEVIEQAKRYMTEGFTIYQQFNCAHCGAKQTMEAPNTFHMLGRCEECGEITNIRQRGCNYMLMISRRGAKNV